MMKRKPYDSEVDIFFVNEGWKKGETFRGNIVVGDVVLDVSTKDVIRGVEILFATSFFKDLGIDGAFLERVEKAEMGVNQKKDSCTITLRLFAEGDVRNCRIALAWEAPLLSA